MNGCNPRRGWGAGLLGLCLWSSLAVADPPPAGTALPGNQRERRDDNLPRPRREENGKDAKSYADIEAKLPQPAPSILPPDANAITLNCVLRLAGVENPEINIARQRVVGAEALRLLAYAQLLPNLNVGTNYDAHTGPLQQSDGNILKVNREALYLGLGAGAIAAGTVNIPGLLWAGNPGAGIFDLLAARQFVQVRQFESLAVRNQILLRVADAYLDTLRAEGRRSIAVKNQQEAHEVARLSAINAAAGQRKESDANRAAAELANRNDLIVEAENEMMVASARLAQLLNLPPTIQLHPVDGYNVAMQIVPEDIPLGGLIYTAINRRPELAARQAAIRAANNILRSAKVLPFSPNVWGGFSAGTFGGGSNLASGFGFPESRFGNMAPRDDVDVILYWTAQNMGLGNWAKIKLRLSERRITELEFVRDLNMVRNDVARAYAGIHARFAQMSIAATSVKSAEGAYKEDYKRIFTTDTGLPIELLNSFRLLAAGRYNYFDAVVNYDRAQFAMYVALGQPPADVLAHAMPPELVPPPAPAPPLPFCTAGNGGACGNNCGVANVGQTPPAVLPAVTEPKANTTTQPQP
jgi:outer membrane protein TolC